MTQFATINLTQVESKSLPHSYTPRECRTTYKGRTIILTWVEELGISSLRLRIDPEGWRGVASKISDIIKNPTSGLLTKAGAILVGGLSIYLLVGIGHELYHFKGIPSAINISLYSGAIYVNTGMMKSYFKNKPIGS